MPQPSTQEAKIRRSPSYKRESVGLSIRVPAHVRFDKFTAKSDSGCWEWTGGKSHDGYGLFRGVVEGEVYRKAHRYSYAYHKNLVIPEDMHVLHKCDNRGCVNPAHLFLGTNADNMADRDAKGRHRAAKGEDAGKAKLTELQAIAILGDSRTQAIIAKEYGISPMTVSDIKRRYSWNHLAHIPSVKSESDKHSGRQGKSQNLDEEKVKEIRTSTEKYGILAARYGISVPTACDIRKRKSWKHVE